MSEKVGKVIYSSPQSVWVEINEASVFEKNKKNLQVGKFLSIDDGNLNKVICSIQNIKAKEVSSSEGYTVDYGKFIVETQPIGTIQGNVFKRGSNSLPIPMEEVHVLDDDIISMIFSRNDDFNFEFGTLLQNNSVPLFIDGDKFFGKHIAVVGSTGSGKSCTVARILQNAVGINENENKHKEVQKNSHIIIFDMHSEYKKAFNLSQDEGFTLNYLDVSTLKLPYWLMNSEELENLFIESNEGNSHNQISILRKAIILNKEKYNRNISKIDYDTPVYFSIKEVYNYIYNSNVATKDANTGELQFVNPVDGLESEEYQLFENISFKSKDRGKINDGPFATEFDRFVIRLNTTLNDKRIKFITEPLKEDGSEFKTDDFTEILKQFIGYINKSNVSIIDLSGVPFEVLSITVSLISRIIFDFSFHYSKIKNEANALNDNPILIVFEEAHNYIPRSSESSYKSVKRSVERIAKEGRKYGLGSMIVSQRPSEISETILAQCNNFVALRLTNPNDQNFVKRLLPDSIASISDVLPSLGKGQCLLVGDSVPIPALVQLNMPNPAPSSDDIPFVKEWSTSWKDITFDDVIRRWKKE
ncbi:ATP-binding protein [Paenibacillus illinoisensis]|uniref:ATP-binding protein n=1 Tax=Paenibacillus illinoisensis TaxID=59845 RepID=UPI00203F0DC1|nr:ATP-binding protein [Paenibacillus illinoisensis]MCM3202905.1 ATP-binding protein [Paenibacillus illinoisensis]